MSVVTFKIPNEKLREVLNYVYKTGGKRVVSEQEPDPDDIVTHEVFFGENIKRLIKAFRK